MVGDRGMLTQPQIDKLKLHSGLDWITALTITAIRAWWSRGPKTLCYLGELNGSA